MNAAANEKGTLIIEYYISEMMDAKCIIVADEIWQSFVEAFKDLGLRVEERRVTEPYGPIADYEHSRAVIESVFSVQGLKREEGESCLPAIERLVSEYARLK